MRRERSGGRVRAARPGKGKPVSVIIPIKDYQELLERVKDTDDVVCLKQARRKPLHYRPLEDYLADRSRK